MICITFLHGYNIYFLYKLINYSLYCSYCKNRGTDEKVLLPFGVITILFCFPLFIYVNNEIDILKIC